MRPLIDLQESNTTSCYGSSETKASMDRQHHDLHFSKAMGNLEPSTSLVALEQEWRLLRHVQPNVLVVGSDRGVNNALYTLLRRCRQPLVSGVTTDPFVLPAFSDCGSLLLRNVLALSLESQQRLLSWLDDARGRTQVIATAAQPPSLHIDTGAFLDALYYRLNIVYFDLTTARCIDTSMRDDEHVRWDWEKGHGWSEPIKS